jgi:hypothetical protein
MFRPLLAIIFATAFAVGFAVPAKAGNIITSTIGDFDEPLAFDFAPVTTTLDDFSFAIPAGATVYSGTISGTFGNNDVPGLTNVTALSDYFVGGGAIQVAACDDDPTSATFPNFPCDAGSSTGAPVPWSYTFSAGDLATLAPAFAAGSLDFSVTQNFAGSVQTGVITLALNTAPEPATMFVFSLGLAGIAARRRFRKA